MIDVVTNARQKYQLERVGKTSGIDVGHYEFLKVSERSWIQVVNGTEY